MISFSTNKKDLIKTLNSLKAILKGPIKKYLSVICEITVIDGKVKFAIPGCLFELECETEGTAKAAIPFLYFYEIVKAHSKENIKFEIYESNMKCGNIKFKADTWFFPNDKILRTLDIPMNYKDLDLLKLRHQNYTEEELQFNKITRKIDEAEERLKTNLLNAYLILKDYNVSYEEIKKIVDEKIRNG